MLEVLREYFAATAAPLVVFEVAEETFEVVIGSRYQAFPASLFRRQVDLVSPKRLAMNLDVL
jgi:hypothetical protein